tara:strand:- start:1842 stop:2015 length:174 start_codon:yes stop_codon:yes gene_type:complete
MGAFAKFVKILIGLVLIILGAVSYAWWWPALVVLIKGALGLVVIGFGLLAILIAMTE